MRGRKAAQLFLSVDSIHTSQKCFLLLAHSSKGATLGIQPANPHGILQLALIELYRAAYVKMSLRPMVACY